MNWNKLTQAEQLHKIDEESQQEKIFIFKHSSRCNISSAALNRIERKWNSEDHKVVKPYFLDLINYRNLSNEIAAKYNVQHESPQVLIIQNGKCSFTHSHFDITYDDLMKQAGA